jgi:hypothetical protein
MREREEKKMLGTLGKNIEEVQIVKLKDCEALAVVWDNPGQMMRLQIEHPSTGIVDWKVQVIGLVVKEVRERKKKKA